MKIRNYLTIFFAVLAILFLLGLAAWTTVYVGDEANPMRQKIMQIFGPEKSPDVEAPDTEPAAVPTETVSVKEHSFLFVGDSRTLGMKDAVSDGCTYIGAEGEGYQWFSTDGMAAMEAELENDPGRPVILNFGVNDPENVSLYIDLYHSMMDAHPDTPFYFLSVNPVVDSEELNTTNEMISIFNATIGSHFPENFIDSCSYLATIGYETVDGLHYTNETYQAIHDFVVDMVLK